MSFEILKRKAKKVEQLENYVNFLKSGGDKDIENNNVVDKLETAFWNQHTNLQVIDFIIVTYLYFYNNILKNSK